MPSNKSSQNFAEPVEEIIEEEPVVEIKDDLVSARIKGTWIMHWGQQSYNFEDGKRYRLPRDLYAYLRKSGNIYDTL
jgi:hypothetical protein